MRPLRTTSGGLLSLRQCFFSLICRMGFPDRKSTCNFELGRNPIHAAILPLCRRPRASLRCTAVCVLLSDSEIDGALSCSAAGTLRARVCAVMLWAEVCANAGDSRAVLCRDSKPATWLTRALKRLRLSRFLSLALSLSPSLSLLSLPLPPLPPFPSLPSLAPSLPRSLARSLSHSLCLSLFLSLSLFATELGTHAARSQGRTLPGSQAKRSRRARALAPRNKICAQHVGIYVECRYCGTACSWRYRSCRGPHRRDPRWRAGLGLRNLVSREGQRDAV